MATGRPHPCSLECECSPAFLIALRLGVRSENSSVMAGLVPAIHVLQTIRMTGGYVYFLTNRPNGILYVGVTNNLIRRIYEHRSAAVEGFTKRYGLKRLVYFERFDDIRDAIQQEHNIKHWPRAWKVRKIIASNPDWNDLFEAIVK